MECNQEIFDMETLKIILLKKFLFFFKSYEEKYGENLMNWPNPKDIRSLLLSSDQRIFHENLC